jgi:hypothetical protein
MEKKEPHQKTAVLKAQPGNPCTTSGHPQGQSYFYNNAQASVLVLSGVFQTRYDIRWHHGSDSNENINVKNHHRQV